ncbi:MAG: thiF [Firmicutes bacterium]|nr:thiF [Bacillota bacterium]
MAEHELSRVELLIGKENIRKLKDSKVVVLGIGGVGSFAAEALARSGIGHQATSTGR